MKPRLYKSHDRIVGGVCGGIADYLGWEKRPVRFFTMAALLFAGLPVLIYFMLYLVMPDDPRKPFDLNDYRAQ